MVKQKRIITISYWVATFAEGAARMIIPLYFASLGVSPVNIGFMAFAFELFGFLTNLSSGVLINRFGYKKAFLASLLFHSIASFGYLLIRPDLDTLTLMMVVSGLRAARGIGKELMEVTSSSYLKQYNAKGRKGLAAQVLFGGKESIKGGGLLGGGILLTYYGFVESFTILGACTTVFLLFSMIFLSDFKEKKRVRFRDFFKVSKRMKYLAATRMFLYSGRDLWLVIALPIYLTESGVSNLDASFMIASGFIVFGVTQICVGSFIKARPGLGRFSFKSNWRFRDSLFTTHFITALIPLGVFLVPITIENLWYMVILYNLAAGASTVPHNHLHLKYAKKSRSALDISFYKTVAQFGKMFAVLSSGFAYQRYGLEGCLMASSASLLIASGLCLRLNRMESGKSAERKANRKQKKILKEKTKDKTKMNLDKKPK